MVRPGSPVRFWQRAPRPSGLSHRDVAQFGSARRSGRRGPGFKSRHPDHGERRPPRGRRPAGQVPRVRRRAVPHGPGRRRRGTPHGMWRSQAARRSGGPEVPGSNPGIPTTTARPRSSAERASASGAVSAGSNPAEGANNNSSARSGPAGQAGRALASVPPSWRRAHLEGCERGRIGPLGKRVQVRRLPWVRIPLPPLRNSKCEIRNAARRAARAPLAQLAELRPLKPTVLGSIPRGRTKEGCESLAKSARFESGRRPPGARGFESHSLRHATPDVRTPTSDALFGRGAGAWLNGPPC